MDLYTLPATTYVPPARLARKHVLNTIIEDDGTENEEGSQADEDTEEAGRGRARHLVAPRSIGSTSPVPSLTSSVSSYQMSSRRSQDFDELYDVSDDESVPDHDLTPSIRYQDMSTRSTSPNDSLCSTKSRNRYPSLIIPSPGCWPTIEKLKNGSPPLPAKIPLSPAILSLLPQDIPSISQAPSLISSVVSNHQTTSTAPATPDIQQPDVDELWGQVEMKTKAGRRTTIFEDFEPSTFEHLHEGTAGWSQDAGIGSRCNTEVRDFACQPEHCLPESPVLGTDDGYPEEGVQLPAEALKTLQHLSLDIPFRPEISSEDQAKEEEMKEVQGRRSRPSSVDWTPASQQSEYSIAQLSIPSPGDFFSSLGGNARHTWCVPDSRPASVAPPSSTTAEQFYKCPWNQDPLATVECIVEVPETDTDGPPTARQGPVLSMEKLIEPTMNESTVDYDEDYEKTIQEVAERSLDRTSVWLATQTSYMAALRETNPVNDLAADASQEDKRASRHLRDNSLGSPIRKAVRFLEHEATKCEPSDLASTEQSDPIYYHAFQHIANDTTSKDAFRHHRTRADSLQASRSCLPHEHIEQLSGKYNLKDANRPVPLRPISMMPGNGADAEETSEQRVIARVERERQALEQIGASMWAVEAARFLHGGKLLNNPAVDSLLTGGESARVLDLGGQPNCGWAWHCSRAYPNAKVYTATTEHELMDLTLRGPSNHRRTAVVNLWELPYPDNYFTVISTRSLFQYLKQEKPLGEAIDQYDLCLRECLRCLKPGGYLEFFVMDSEVVNAGTLGTAASVEFGFNLKTRGYDPAPTKNWLGRVRRSGFDDIKRAWTFLPMGTLQRESSPLPETPPPDVSTHAMKLEAVQGPVGSTGNAANISGLVGGWAWEQWMLKLQVEMGNEKVLEGIAGVMEEGKSTGAGWRCLNGWARKPCQA
ncbi:MAG: hypothetical protein Q9186_004698 [Xanthomendoza sp. 1 TL-2023]